MTNVGPAYERRTLRLRIARHGDIREESLFGQLHYVVPVVALVEGVVWPANVDEPEFVPAEVLAEHPLGWNGRPVTQSHPQDDEGGFTSANFPEIYEKYTYGLIFHADYVDRKLIMEAWIDPSKVRPGSVAERSLEALRNGEMVEVSVGAYVTRERVEGDYNGQHYYSIWQDIVPDHLAILAEGEIGACSIEMGCGALRVAKAHVNTVTPQGIEITEVEMAVAKSATPNADGKVFCKTHPEVEVKKDSVCALCQPAAPAKKSWKDRFAEILSRFTSAQNAEDMTNYDLQDKLDRALRATEPGYLGVVAVKPEAHQVVYAVYPEERVIYYQRSYTVSDAGDISLGDDRVEVERVERYEPVTAATAAAPPKPQGGCGCQQQSAAAVQTATQGEEQMNKDVLVHALIGSGKFTEANRNFLNTLDEATLNTLMSAPAPAAQTPAPAQTPAAPAAVTPEPATLASASASAQTMEQFIAAAPAHLQQSLRDAHAATVLKRNTTIAALKATGRCTFTDEQLATKTNQELEQLAALAATPAAVDFSGRGLANGTDSSEGVPEPPSLVAAVQNRRKMAQN